MFTVKYKINRLFPPENCSKRFYLNERCENGKFNTYFNVPN